MSNPGAEASAGRPSENRPGHWAISTLIRRHLTVFVADRWNVVLLVLQPALIGWLINLAAVVDPAMPRKLFVGYLGALWIGCSNSAQVIVRERPVFLRERLAGLNLHNYLISKFVCMALFSVVQSLLLYTVLANGGIGLVGNPWLQICAMTGGAVVLSGIGLMISAASNTPTQAVLWVPLVIIPQILFSGYVFGLEYWRKQPPAALVSRICPSYAAQRLVDLSLFWGQQLDDDVLNKYRTAAPNLQNLAMALVPMKTWMTGPQELKFTPAEARRYALQASQMDWPADYPEFRRGGIFNIPELVVYPIQLLVVWYALSYVVALMKLSRTHL